MKLYDKNAFVSGLILLGICLALVITRPDWLNWGSWMVLLILSGRNLYTALSQRESRRQALIRKHFKRVSRALLGPWAWVKLYLPLILLGIWCVILLIIRFTFDRIVPVSVVVVGLLVVTVATVYSIGLNRRIADAIEQEVHEDGAE